MKTRLSRRRALTAMAAFAGVLVTVAIILSSPSRREDKDLSQTTLEATDQPVAAHGGSSPWHAVGVEPDPAAASDPKPPASEGSAPTREDDETDEGIPEWLRKDPLRTAGKLLRTPIQKQLAENLLNPWEVPISPMAAEDIAGQVAADMGELAKLKDRVVHEKLHAFERLYDQGLSEDPPSPSPGDASWSPDHPSYQQPPPRFEGEVVGLISKDNGPMKVVRLNPGYDEQYDAAMADLSALTWYLIERAQELVLRESNEDPTQQEDKR